MARTKGAKNKPKLAPVGAGARPGDNRTVEQLNDDQLQNLTRQHSVKRARLVSEEKTAKANRMNYDRLIKTELGANGLKEIQLLDELETPEGEKEFKDRRDRELRVARWAGLPIGAQGEFEMDRRPAEEKAFEAGKRAGMKGEDCKPPHAPGTGAFDSWIKGWHEGQAVNAAGIRQKQPDAPTLLREEGKQPAGQPDEFDEAAGAGAASSTSEEEDDEKNGDETGGQTDETGTGGEPWTDDKDIAAQQADNL